MQSGSHTASHTTAFDASDIFTGRWRADAGGHLKRKSNVIDVHHQQRGRGGAHARDDSDRAIDLSPRIHHRRDLRLQQPDVLAHRVARAIQLGEQIAPLIVDGEGARMRVGI